MRYPAVQVPGRMQEITEGFLGYNHTRQLRGGELYDMKNLCSDDAPILAVRPRRGVYAALSHPGGMIGKDTLCCIDGRDFIMNGCRVDMGLADGEKTLVSMGAFVIILPDKKYINTADLTDFGNIEAEYTSLGTVRCQLCSAQGEPLTVHYRQDTPPAEPAEGQRWMDTGSHMLKEYSGVWSPAAATYIRLSAAGIGRPFAQYDGVRIAGAELDGSWVIWDKGEDFLVLPGLLEEEREVQTSVTVRRCMPQMDFLIESENRLWGCRYGLADNGEIVNELYASKLGDFKNWECYMGVATDSYRVSLGTDGQFTGAAAYLGHPLFFKEGCIHKVFGNFPANFQVQTTACRGVQKGSSRSLAAVNEILYYLSDSGVCAYDGSLPRQVSGALGQVRYRNGVGGAMGSRYYVSMESGEGRSLFVYDTGKGLWHREDAVVPMCFCQARGELYFIDTADGKVKTVSGAGEKCEGDVEWMAETGVLGLEQVGSKYFPKLILRVSMAAGAWMEIDLEYDSQGRWETAAHLRGERLERFTVPIRPRRCDHMRLRLRGRGEVRVYGLTRVMAAGRGKAAGMPDNAWLIGD